MPRGSKVIEKKCVLCLEVKDKDEFSIVVRQSGVTKGNSYRLNICKPCLKAKAAAFFARREYKRKPESKRRLGRLYRARHKDKIRIGKREWRRKNPEKVRAEKLRRAHGMTTEMYDAFWNAQNGMCAICGATEADWRRKHLVVDHCHTTGRIRGLLCHPCNTAIGHLKDSPELLRKAAQYVEDRMDGPKQNFDLSTVPKEKVA